MPVDLKAEITYTVTEVAEVLRIHRDKARRLMHDGAIPYIWVGREMRVHRNDLIRFLRSGTKHERPKRV